MFTQYERQFEPTLQPNSRCGPSPYEKAVTYSKVTVFNTREVEYEYGKLVSCVAEGGGDKPARMQWNVPPGVSTISRHVLTEPEFQRFASFLERSDVKAIESFMNGGRGVGDFKIVIDRPSGTQNIEVLSLLPNHFQLVQNPTLVRLICMGKAVARATSAEPPEWCREPRP